jgi:hypothetical protein
VATHQDLLDAIARIRTATGDPDGWTAGLTGEDIAVVTDPLSRPAELGAVMAKLIAAHPGSFLPGAPAGPASEPVPPAPQGAAAEAIREAQEALGQQKSAVSQADLHVLAAVLNAHAGRAEGVAALDRLQREIEEAVAARADLDTPAGARAFQRYLVDRLREIRAVVESAGLDSAAKAALAEALTNLYASSTPQLAGSGGGEGGPVAPKPSPERGEDTGDEDTGEGDPANGGEVLGGDPGDRVGWMPDPLPALRDDFGLPLSDPAAQPIPPPPAAMAAPVPGWGAGLPPAAPFGGGMAAPAAPSLSTDPPREWTDYLRRDSVPTPAQDPDADTAGELQQDPEREAAQDPDESAIESAADETAAVELPGGQTVLAPSPELAAVITAAVAGTPIAEAFRQQGIAIAEPGMPVTGSLDPQQLLPGDIGVLTDRHALALGSGTALLDQQIVPLASVMGQGFLGWQHPPAPQTEPMPTPPAPPAPIPSVPTAPS